MGDGLGIPDYVERAKQVVADSVDVPDGYRIAWAGQFKSFERAKARLQILVPLTLGLIFFMLFMHRASFTETLIVMLTIPFSLVGSIWLLWFLGYKLSVAVAVAVGMIAVAGQRIRPMLMTGLALFMGLISIMYTSDTGADAA
ncbi:MAG: efflux RND transporter permease subunit [Salinisphaeraceae bacterium]|uniref:Efflux RND transporter permease subunit n=1 Tax=Spectribacter hydrogenoxidans TaxID=3075608 RepID=A0ABU3C310_9GAMM|nr:efflux RND transporter permease subunit [Salinisphaera sp. W335]MDT0635930.1 efflux RND transporter permease subunit [Salinisphaera sp. W335]